MSLVCTDSKPKVIWQKNRQVDHISYYIIHYYNYSFSCTLIVICCFVPRFNMSTHSRKKGKSFPSNTIRTNFTSPWWENIMEYVNRKIISEQFKKKNYDSFWETFSVRFSNSTVPYRCNTVKWWWWWEHKLFGWRPYGREL